VVGGSTISLGDDKNEVHGRFSTGTQRNFAKYDVPTNTNAMVMPIETYHHLNFNM
jgi:hypothetical protein